MAVRGRGVTHLEVRTNVRQRREVIIEGQDLSRVIPSIGRFTVNPYIELGVNVQSFTGSVVGNWRKKERKKGGEGYEKKGTKRRMGSEEDVFEERRCGERNGENT